MKKNYIFIFVFLLMFSFVSAVPPFTTTGDFSNGYIPIESQQDYLSLDHYYVYHFYLYNESDGENINNDYVNCSFALTNSYGDVLFFDNVSYIDDYWEINISGEYFDYVGEYSYGLNCQNGYGGALAGTFEVTPDGRPSNLQNFLMSCLLIVFLFSIIVMIKNIHKKTDFDSKKENLINSKKNMGQKMAVGILQSLFKNSFIWIYSIGWFIVMILKEMVLRFSSLEFYGYFELFANIYSLGFLLVTVYMIGYTMNYMKDMISVLTEKSWGISR